MNFNDCGLKAHVGPKLLLHRIEETIVTRDPRSYTPEAASVPGEQGNHSRSTSIAARTMGSVFYSASHVLTCIINATATPRKPWVTQ
jgi:hypothetical protein